VATKFQWHFFPSRLDYRFTGMSYRLSRSLCHSRQLEEVGSRARQLGYERPTLLNKINHGKQCRNGHKVTLPSRLYKVSLCPSINRSRHTYYIYTIEYQGTVNHEEEKKNLSHRSRRYCIFFVCLFEPRKNTTMTMEATTMRAETKSFISSTNPLGK
jgi:hypothetical protein